MKIPVHVVPVGDAEVGGDVAIVSLVAPELVRKNTRVSAQVFVRSYGYKGNRAELKIVTRRAATASRPPIARMPIVLQEGLNSYTLGFESGDQDRRVEARIDPLPGEVSSSNNSFAAELAIDHTKIRVLYLEGATDRYVRAADARAALAASARRPWARTIHFNRPSWKIPTSNALP